MRILHDNAADRATITLPNTATGMGPTSLQTDVRSEVCRVQSSTATITANWVADERIDAVVLPAIALSPSATIRVRLYDASNVLLTDSGVKPANPSGIARPSDVGLYLPSMTLARRLVVTLVDSGRAYLDIPRLIAGEAHAFRYGASYGAARAMDDTSTHQRTAAGDLRTELGTLSPALPFDLGAVDAGDHALVLDILESGMGRTMWVDLTAHGEFSSSVHRAMRIYGRQDRGGAVAFIAPALHQTQFNFLSW